jgi:hypothetical protein
MMARGGLTAASEICRTSPLRWTISRNNDIFSPQYPVGGETPFVRIITEFALHSQGCIDLFRASQLNPL